MLSISVKQISEGLRNKRIDLLDISEACLKRAREINSLNAFIRITEESFLQQTHEARKRYIDGNPRSIIEGIPVAIKDNFCTKSFPTTCASRMLENFKPPYDATVVERLNDAGACMLGKTNMDEFAMGSGTVDSIFGPTKNIWRSGIKYTLKYYTGNGAKIPRPSYETPIDGAGEDWFIAGGSSGGSAVAVASGACFIAIGSDTGGSTRNPAAYCGVVGMKPSYGLVSRHGLIPLVNSMDVPGVFGRSVDDVCCVLGNISGHDSKDSTTVPASLVDIVKGMGREAPSDISGLCVGIPKEYHCPGMSPEVISMWGDVADTLEKAGAKVIEVSLPYTQYSVACYSILNQCEVASNMARYDGIEFGIRGTETVSTEEMIASSRAIGFNEVVRGRILAGNYFLLKRNYQKYFEKALKLRRLIADDFQKAWDSGVNFLLTPVTLGDAPRFSEFSSKDNREQCASQDYCTQPVNMAGCPAVSIPIRLSKRGLPLSLQVIGKIYDDGNLLMLAKWIENAANFPQLVIE